MEIELDKKEMIVKLEVETDMKLDQVIDVLISRSMRQGLAAEIYDLSKEHYVSGKIVKKRFPCATASSRTTPRRS